MDAVNKYLVQRNKFSRGLYTAELIPERKPNGET